MLAPHNGPPPPIPNGAQMHGSPMNGSPMMPPASPPRKQQSSPKQIKEDWRKHTRSQPDLNPDDLLPPANKHANIHANSARHMNARRGGHRGRGRGRGPLRYHGPPGHGPPPPDYYGPGPMGGGHYGPPPDLMDDEDMDPNHLMFAKIDAEEAAGDFDDDFRGGPPGPAQPMDWAELNEQEMHHHPPALPHMQPRPPTQNQNIPPRGDVRDRQKQRRGMPPRDPRDGGGHGQRRERPRRERDPSQYNANSKYAKKGASRYSRQYSSPQNGPAPKTNSAQDMTLTPEQMDMTQYELSGDFQTLSMGKGAAPRYAQRGRRRHRNDRVPPPKTEGPILDSLNEKGRKSKDDAKNEKTGVEKSKTSVVVTSKPAPMNWAQAQKPKAKKKSSVNASGFLTGFTPHGARKKVTKVNSSRGGGGGGGQGMSSSSRPMEAERVSHVLEVLNMSAGDHQTVSVLFRSFEMHFQTLMSVKGRWFVCLDDERLAMKALNVVKDPQGKFQLRRIDCNARDVQMLKNNVPPAMQRERGGGDRGYVSRRQQQQQQQQQY